MNGEEKLKVVDNHVRIHDTETLKFEQVPGHIKVTIKVLNVFIPDEFVEKMRVQNPEFVHGGEITLLDLKVVKPGMVKVCGYWSDYDKAVIITENELAFVNPDQKQALSLVGEGENSVLMYAGSIDCSLFGFQQANYGA